MTTQYENLSADLIWECCRNNNAFLAKRRLGSSGKVQFSRDPLNVLNKHSRKYEGFVNDQAIGINPDSSNTIALTTKTRNANKPAKLYQTSSFSASTPSRKLYKSIVNSTAKKGYRADIRAEAVARASAVRQSQREKRDSKREVKPRGAKARKAAAEKAES